MAEKDIAEKILADYNDVFADILNVFMFHGERRIYPDNLEPVKDQSQYKVDGKLHEQERDVSKKLMEGDLVVSMFGFEHQTGAEKFMPVRLIGYDGQSYRSQLLEIGQTRIYPIISIVLYFGMTRWPYSRCLMDLMDVPEEYKPFVSDYEMKNLFEIAFLEPEQVNLFQSDFKYVADYFVQKRLTDDYKPSVETIKHVDAVLKLMKVLTGDDRFEKVIPELPKGGNISMCDVLDRVENKGHIKGEEDGMNRFGKLINVLVKAGRQDDIVKVSSNPTYRDKLLKEFGI